MSITNCYVKSTSSTSNAKFASTGLNERILFKDGSTFSSKYIVTTYSSYGMASDKKIDILVKGDGGVTADDVYYSVFTGSGFPTISETYVGSASTSTSSLYLVWYTSTSGSTYTKTSATGSSFTVYVVGGGGSGAGTNGTHWYGGAGAGGGVAGITATWLSDTLKIYYKTGSGGSAPSAGANNGSSGVASYAYIANAYGNTTSRYAAMLTANGGGYGYYNPNSSTSSFGAGGTASVEVSSTYVNSTQSGFYTYLTANSSGGRGGADSRSSNSSAPGSCSITPIRISSANGTTATGEKRTITTNSGTITSDGGASWAKGGIRPDNSNTTSGVAGTAPGGGGSGARGSSIWSSDYSGGAGGAGAFLIKYSTPLTTTIDTSTSTGTTYSCGCVLRNGVVISNPSCLGWNCGAVTQME